MMLASWRKIEQEKEEINKINVFPVPDQDTGNNIAKTLSGIKEAVENKEFENISGLADAILEGALSNAQGNAGVIYTGFLAGFLEEISASSNSNPLEAEGLTRGFERGAAAARESIQHPREGTILDVIDAAAATFRKQSGKEKDIIKILRDVKEAAGKALMETREKMEIFKKANVVDAGGLGFLIILEAYLEALEGKGPPAGGEEEKEASSAEQIKRFVQVLSNRYEIVSLIEDSPFSQKEITEKLKRFGNCLDIVRVKNRIKIHIHTDYPEEVKEMMRGLGQIQDLRMEDMSNEVVGEESLRTISIGLMVDDQALLLPKIEERYHIQKINFHSTLRQEEGGIFQAMERKKDFLFPSFSPPTADEYLQAFHKQLNDFKKVLCITGSSKISAAFRNAMEAKKQLEDPKRVFVLDSLNAAGGQTLILLRAIELIQEQWELEEVIKKLRVLIPQVRSYAAAKDMRWLDKVQGIKPAYARWARNIDKIIKLNPLFEIKNGHYRKGGVVLAEGYRQALIKKTIRNSRKKRKVSKKIRILIGHSNNIKEAESIKKEIKSRMKEAEVPFIGVNPEASTAGFGPGCLTLSWLAET